MDNSLQDVHARGWMSRGTAPERIEWNGPTDDSGRAVGSRAAARSPQTTSGAGQKSYPLADGQSFRLAAGRPGGILARLERLSAGESGANAQTADALPARRERLPGHARGFPDLAGRPGWAQRRAIYYVSGPQPPLYARRRREKGHSRHLHRGWSCG